MSKCILCGSDSELYEEYSVDDLVKGYEHHYGKVPNDIFDEACSMRKCKKCGLVFADPIKGGSNKYYEWVTKQKGYYTSFRWEWMKIAEYINSVKKSDIKLIEVGCGVGFFLDYIMDKCPEISAVGIDMTKTSVEECRRKGHEAFCGTLEDYIAKNPSQKADYVMSFHTLEHVYNPKQFVLEMLSICKDDGLCINAIPYTVDTKTPWWDVLNSPPHHMTRWNKSAIEELGRQTDCRIEILANDNFNPYNETMGMLKLKYYPVYKQPSNRLIDFKLRIIKSAEYKKELERNLNREKIGCTNSIGEEVKEITIPYHITMIFRKNMN
ncbi:MAG: class I SAM-dependent methyltransferase [Lachnospiraceae bacterium]|nr:class I SAM-dependent methyltransferase [Lachnospiraceae bacterium]